MKKIASTRPGGYAEYMKRLIEGARKARRYLNYLGAREALAVLAREASSGTQHELSITHPGLSHPVFVRTHSSDIETFGKVIAAREYDVPELSSARVIIDAGANIGLASVYFAQRFPAARIIALEPETSNFDVLLRNVAHLPNVTCVKKALWAESGAITIYDPGDGNWGFRTASSTDYTAALGTLIAQVDCVSIPDLMKEYGFDKVDLLKIDIEGSEKEVFTASADWIDRVDVIVAELHDRFRRGCSRAFYEATADFAREVHKGENVFVFRAAS